MNPFQQMKQWAKEYDNNLRADDPRFKRVVLIQHMDGTALTFVWAFVVFYPMPEPIDREFLVVFTEHHGWHWYDPEDLNNWYQFELTPKPGEEFLLEQEDE